MSTQRTWRITRRGFLIGVGAAGASLALGVVASAPLVRLNMVDYIEGAADTPASFEEPPTAWFEISPDNRVTLYLPKVEMGQGVHTALAQVATEELEVDWRQITVAQATTHVGPYDSRGTSGSTSVATLYQPLRETAATMREMLRAEAARQLGVAASDLTIKDGVLTLAGAGAQALTYGQVVQHVQEWTVPENPPPLKSRETFRYIGQPLPRVDLPAKVTGEAIYGFDVRLPGTLYGAVARPPMLEATLRRAAPGAAPNQPGVVTVVSEPGFAGVVADSWIAARQGLYAMDLEWSDARPWQQAEIEQLITVGQGTGVVIQKVGDAEAQLGVSQVISATYRTPMAAHAHLEAQAALADVQAERVRVWVSTQFPDLVRKEVAKVLDRATEAVEVVPTFLGGGFGRKSGIEPAVEAARLSTAAGKPVHVGWSRSEDFQHGYVRPPTHHVLQARLDANGKIAVIEHQQASGHVAFGFIPGFLKVLMGADFGAWRGALVPYAAPHVRTVAWRNDLPLRTGWWRGLGLLANVFALESFVDELAHAAGVDPLQFRLDHLPNNETGERFRRVLATAAERAGWDTPTPQGRARGLACCIDAKTVVAHIAEVSVDRGAVRVHRVTAVVDPGLVVNPDGAQAQIEGAITMGLSSTLLEKLTVKDGKIVPGNFNQYPLLTMQDTPEIDVVLLESGEAPHGLGEPPMGPIAAAVANGVFTLTGQRLRELPLTPGEG